MRGVLVHRFPFVWPPKYLRQVRAEHTGGTFKVSSWLIGFAYSTFLAVMLWLLFVATPCIILLVTFFR